MVTRALLWDMDGVIVDSREAHFASWQAALNEFGLPITEDEFVRTFGMANAGILNLLFENRLTPEEIIAISDRKEDLFRQMVKGRLVMLPGAKTWLQEAARRGYRQALASSAPLENIDAIVDELELRQLFEALVSGGVLPASKPDPAIFLLAAQSVHVPPTHCVVIEDAVAGVEAAKRAKMRCIAVTTTNPAERLSKADIVVPTLEHLSLDEIEGWFQQRLEIC